MQPDETATVRSATAADMPAIARLAARLVRQHHALDPERFMIFEPVEPSYERYLTGELNDPDAVVLAAVRGESVAGYAYGRMEPRDWNALRDACGALHDIYVDEGVRRQGTARLLLEEMIRRLEAKGAPRVVLMTAWGNTAAQRLFESFGFRRTMVEMAVEIRRK
jgi:ribosomal protein S18 acetylase RimI-like enzyme